MTCTRSQPGKLPEVDDVNTACRACARATNSKAELADLMSMWLCAQRHALLGQPLLSVKGAANPFQYPAAASTSSAATSTSAAASTSTALQSQRRWGQMLEECDDPVCELCGAVATLYNAWTCRRCRLAWHDACMTCSHPGLPLLSMCVACGAKEQHDELLVLVAPPTSQAKDKLDLLLIGLAAEQADKSPGGKPPMAIVVQEELDDAGATAFARKLRGLHPEVQVFVNMAAADGEMEERGYLPLVVPGEARTGLPFVVATRLIRPTASLAEAQTTLRNSAASRSLLAAADGLPPAALAEAQMALRKHLHQQWLPRRLPKKLEERRRTKYIEERAPTPPPLDQPRLHGGRAWLSELTLAGGFIQRSRQHGRARLHLGRSEMCVQLEEVTGGQLLLPTTALVCVGLLQETSEISFVFNGDLQEFVEMNARSHLSTPDALNHFTRLCACAEVHPQRLAQEGPREHDVTEEQLAQLAPGCRTFTLTFGFFVDKDGRNSASKSPARNPTSLPRTRTTLLPSL